MTLVGHDGSVLVVGNGHIISGQYKDNYEDHRIPGTSPEARTRFKQTALRNIITQLKADVKVACRGRSAASRGAFVLCGDMNLTQGYVNEALRQGLFAGVRALCLQEGLTSPNGPQQHDWIITDSNMEAAEVQSINSHDNQHGLVAADIEHPGPVLAAPQQSQMQELRNRLVLHDQNHHRQREQRDRDDEEQRLAMAAEAEAAAAKRRRVEPSQAGQALCIAAFVFPLRRIFESVGDRCDCDCRW